MALNDQVSPEDVRAKAGIIEESTPKLEMPAVDAPTLSPAVEETPIADPMPADDSIPPVENLTPHEYYLAEKDNPPPDIQTIYNTTKLFTGALLLSTDVEERAWDYERQKLQPFVDVREERENAFKELRESQKLEAEKNKPTLHESMTSMFLLENNVTSQFANLDIPIMPAQAGYNPFDYPDMDDYWPIADTLAKSVHPSQTAIMKQNYDFEKEQRRVIGETSTFTNIVSGIAAGIADPYLFLAFAKVPKAIMTGTNATKMAYGAGVGVSVDAINEVIFHSNQSMRTLEESALNLTASVLLDGVLGGAYLGYKGLKNPEYKKLHDEIKGNIKGTTDYSQYANFNSSGDLSAARFREETVVPVKWSPKSQPIKWALGETAFQFSKRISPIGKGLSANSNKARIATLDLAETNINVTGEQGRVAAESLIKVDLARAGETTLEVDGIQTQALREQGMAGGLFESEIDRAMRDDFHENPIIEGAAAKLRQARDLLIKSAAAARVPGTFVEVDGVVKPVDVSTAKAYWSRVFSKDAISADIAKFKNDIKAGAMAKRQQKNDAIQSQIDQLRVKGGSSDEIEKLRGEMLPEYTNAELEQFATSYYQGVMNLKSGDINSPAMGNPNILKRRVEIDDEFLRPWLEKDWKKKLHHHALVLSPRTRLAEKFGDFEMDKSLMDIFDDYSGRMETLYEEGNAKGAEKLGVERDDQISNLKLMRDRLLGRTGHDESTTARHKVGRSVLNWNTAILLNGQLITSLPELAKVTARHGVFKATIASFKTFARNWRIKSLPKNQAGRLASALYRSQNLHTPMASELSELDPVGFLDKASKATAQLTHYTSGQKGFDSVFKTVAGDLSADEFSRKVAKGDKKYLKKLGFDEDHIQVIMREYPIHKTVDGDLINPHVESWDLRLEEKDYFRPQEVRDIFDAAIIRDADTLLVMPGVGDKPRMMDELHWKIILQFKSFLMGAFNRTLIPMLQGSNWDAARMITQSAMLSLGSMALYERASGVKVDWDNPLALTNEIINRGGLTGYASELMQMALKYGGSQPASRYVNRNDLGMFLGPTAGTFQRMLTAFKPAMEEETGDFIVDADARVGAIRRLMPMQNHFLIRRMLDQVEGNIARYFGGEGRAAD